MGQRREEERNTKSLQQKGGREGDCTRFVLAHPVSSRIPAPFTLAPKALGMPPASIGYSPWRLAQAGKWATVDGASSTLGAEKRLLPGLLSTPLHATPRHKAWRGACSVLFVELKA